MRTRSENPARAASDGRYRFLGDLGQGGFGLVELVHDRERDRPVARKRVRAFGGDALRRMKQEFRVVSELRHPNLVRVHELGQDDDGLFFTMEHVPGIDVASYCARRVRVEALRTLLPQLLSGVSHLHAHGIVHRDLKPANILVDARGRLKVLDFGLVASLDRGSRRVITGTLGYMAPEQIRGEPVSPKVDVYALGALMFELAVGRLPFVGPPDEVREAHLICDAPQLSTFSPGMPTVLERACLAALSKSPEVRPTLEELSLMLAPLFESSPALAQRRTRPLLGRDALLAELRVMRERESMIVLRGPSGIGKTALAQELARDRPLLFGRARPSETVAFNALDGAVDDLSSALELLAEPTAEARAAAVVASRTFPVLADFGRVDAHHARVRDAVRARLFGIDARDTAPRGRVFEAIGTLLAELGSGASVVIDDLQWADQDSLAVLGHLVQAHPAIRIVATLRDDLGDTPSIAWLTGRTEACIVDVPPLDDATILAIARGAAERVGVIPSEADLAAAVASVAGRPLLAEVAGRSAAHPGGSTLEEGVRALPAAERGVLAALIAAGTWTLTTTLADVCDLEVQVTLDAVDALAHRAFVRIGEQRGAEVRVDIYHDAVRAAAITALGDDAVRVAHARFADRLVSGSSPDLVALVRHLLGVGRESEAAALAGAAAERAEGLRAYGLAASMYDIALRRPSARDEEWLTRMAVALEKAAQYDEAATCWRRLCGIATERGRREEAIDARLHEAHAFLAANRIREGRKCLDDALRASGHPASGTTFFRDLAAGVRFLMGPPAPKRSALRASSSAPATRDATATMRGRRDVKLGMMLSFFDPLSGIRFMQGARKTFVAAGAREEAAWCDAIFAHFAQYGTPKRGPVPLAVRYREAANARLGGSPVPPELEAIGDFLDGTDAKREARFADAVAHFERASTILEEAGLRGTFEHMIVLSMRSQLHFFQQDIPRLRADFTRFRTVAEDSRETAIRTHVLFLEMGLRLLEGRIDDAIAVLATAAQVIPSDEATIQALVLRRYESWLALYAGDVAKAHAVHTAAVAAGRRYRLTESMYRALFMTIGGSIEAAAVRAGIKGARPRRVERFARLHDASPPLCRGVSSRTRAYVADAKGRPEHALALLAQAEHEAQEAGRRIDVLVARYQRGMRLGGDEGRALVERAEAEVVALGSRPVVLREDPIIG
jgi:eukaryotic-like serine/threonine-protein kinase